MRRVPKIACPQADREDIGRAIGAVDLELRIRRPALEHLHRRSIGDDERLEL